MERHPLSLALSSSLPVSPSFIYLHHPFHSSGYALPANFANGQPSTAEPTNGRESQDGSIEEEDIGRVVVTVNVAALGEGGHDTTSLSQKAFYNAVIRKLFASISTKLSLLEQQTSHNGKESTAQNPQHSPKRSRKKGSTTVTDHSAVGSTAFLENFAVISRKDVYRWDVFLVRVRAMMNAFRSAVSILRHRTVQGITELGSAEISLTLVILEGHLLQKCLGGTWHALLRLNEMVSTPLPSTWF